LRTQLKICTEADYLQAHITAIAAESRHWDPALYNLKQWVTSILKKWIGVVSRARSRYVALSDIGRTRTSSFR
jgi:hypothetical protein